VTVYVGADGGWREAEQLAEELQGQIDGLQVEVIYGGQPHYHYLASVE
jgi:dihydroxyacetone kinase-like predicted kinase